MPTRPFALVVVVEGMLQVPVQGSLPMILSVAAIGAVWFTRSLAHFR